MRCFLSHNKADKPLARKIGAHLTLSGQDVWFDEWEIQAGDSIPGKLNEGLGGFNAFILVWSANANRSNWVRKELNTAIMRSIEDGSAKIIPCMVDGTPVPPLIADHKRIDFSDEMIGLSELLEGLLGKRTRKEKLLALQSAMEDLDVNWNYDPMAGTYACCPKCGHEELKGWQQADYKNNRNYAGIECPKCSWSEGGET